MPIVVSLRAFINEMDILSDEHIAYLNRRTGEFITLTQDDWYALEHADESEDLPQWQREILPKLREVEESDDWLAPPSKFDIHEYSIMERFCYSVQNPEQREQLLNAIRGRGAFRYFKDTIHRFGIKDDWYRFRDHALEEIAVKWLESHGITYTKDTESL